MNSPWLTLSEAAEYSRLSVRSLRRLIHTGRLRRCGLAKAILIHRDHLDSQIEKRFPVLELKSVPRRKRSGPQRLV
jgi:excisionase family DNA binding protein